jgi:hypothetical protein
MTLVRIPAAPVAFLIAALCSAAPWPAEAVPYSVRLGLEKLVLDAPPGFTDTIELASPRLEDLAATLTEPSNRVLLFALSDGDLRRFTQGEQLEARRYMIAVTPKGLERDRVSATQFGTLVVESLQGLGKPMEVPDLAKYLEAQPVGKSVLVAELRREPNSVSVMQATRLPPLAGAHMFDARKPQYLAFTRTIFLVRGKALQISVFSMYESPADLDWLKVMTQRWQDELIRLNR